MTSAKNIRLVFSEISPGGTVEPHTHEDLEQAYYILDGKMILVSRDGDRELGRNTAVYIPPGEKHGIRVMGEKPLHLIGIFSQSTDAILRGSGIGRPLG